jgi:hypothetical protein
MDDGRDVLLRLVGSLTLCDHMGDVGEAIETALRLIGLNIDWDEWTDLRRELGKMGITTLHGTSLADE